MRKWSLLIAVFSLVLIIAVGCGKDSEEVEADDEKEDVKEEEKEEVSASDLGDFDIQFSGDVKEEDESFIIDGESNLLPDTRITGEIVVDDGETVFADTSELITEDGTFHMELDHHEYGDAEISIRFDFEGTQEDEIKRHYGEKGQNLEGPFIHKYSTNSDDNLRKAEVNIPYESGGTNDLAIKAPEWQELPDDMGDPRVWIEADEVTEDGEFFYITGSSNIIEGAEIKAEYGGNRTKTNILPDGTFEMKLDYEYLEDKDLLILFHPEDYNQYNEIHETYGEEGQKLVGNLVTKDKHTDKQFVEKVVDWDESGSDPEEEDDNNDENDNEQDDDENNEEEEE